MSIGDYIFLISCLILSYILYLCSPYAVIGGLLLFTLCSYIALKSDEKNKV